MTDLFAIGTSGLKAYTAALGTVSDNIANSQTAGYVRRSIQTSEAVGGGNSVYYREPIGPGGTTIDGVTRAVNDWLVEDARVAGGEANRTGARFDWLEAGERTLASGAVGTKLTEVFNAADRLSAAPDNTTMRASFLQSVDDSAAAFRQTAAGLADISSGIASDATASVNGLNASLEGLQRVNDALRRARSGSTNEAGLLDERDRLLDNITGSVAVTIEFDGRGAASVRLSPPSGQPLVDSGIVNAVTVSALADGTLAFAVGGIGFAPLSGRLAGLSEVAATISGQRTTLDALANQFAADLNTAHQGGLDAAGNAGVALLAGTGAAALAAIALTPDRVAAADTTSANGNLLALATLRGPSGGEAGWAALVASHAQTTAATRAQDAAASTRRDGADAARADLSAVDLDHEAAELLRFQQAYQAAARVIQVAREITQSILNAF
jgi:flagellar hook-associated protein 1